MRSSPGDAPAQDVLQLQTFNPRTGRSREVPLRFVEEGGRFYLLAPREPAPRWVAEATQGLLRWRVGPNAYGGRAEIVGPGEDRAATILGRFEEKYGAERIHLWFGRAHLCLVLLADATLSGDYHLTVEALFDAAAQNYDTDVGGNPFDAHLRRISLQSLRETFHPGERLLEIGCGTGLETIPLAQAGMEVVAVDISQAMLDLLGEKAAAVGVGDRILRRRLRAADLGALVREFGSGAFQGAFSTFGAINCEPDYRRMAVPLGELISPGGRLVLGVWNRVCMMEILLFALGLNPRRALARLRYPVPVGLSRFGIPVYPHSPRDLVDLLAPNFLQEEIIGLPVFIPPYDLGPRLPTLGILFPALESLDRRLRGRYPFNRLGDHFLLRLRRR